MRIYHTLIRVLSFFVVLGLFDPTASWGLIQNDDLTKLREEFESAVGIDEATSAKIREQLDVAQTASTQIAHFEEQLNTINRLPPVDQRRNLVELEQQQFKLKKQPEIPASIEPAQLQQLILDNRQQVEQFSRIVQNLESESTRRRTRLEEIRARLITLEGLKTESQAQLNAIPSSDAALLARVNRLLSEIQLSSFDREASYLNAEKARYDLEEQVDLVRLERDLNREKLSFHQNYLARLEQKNSEYQAQRAEATAQEAKQEQATIESQIPELATSYQINTELAERNKEVVSRVAEIKDELDTVKKRLDGLQRQFSETKSMVDQVGLSGSVGALLRKRKGDLPNAQSRLIRARAAKAEVDDIQFELFEVDRRLSELSRDSIVTEIDSNANLSSAADNSQLESQIESLIKSRRDLLTDTRMNLNQLFESLVDLEFRNRSVAELTGEYKGYVNERILWIRSNKLLFSELGVDESDFRVLDRQEWQTLRQKCWTLLRDNTLGFSLVGLLVFGLLAIKQRLRKEIAEMGQAAKRGSCDTFWPTGRTLTATVMTSIALPLLLVGFGLAIRQSDLNDGKSLFSALGSALLAAAWFALPVELFRQICRPRGLGEWHFLWPITAVKILKQNLDWLSPIGTVIVFVITLLRQLDPTLRIDLTERLLFLVGMICLFVFLYRCFNPKWGIFHDYLNSHERSWARQTSAIWFGAILLLPLTLATLTVFGYFYTALNLFTCAFATLVFAILVETVRALLLRFVLVRRRQVHIEASKRKRAATREKRKTDLAEAQATQPAAAAPATEQPDDVVAITLESLAETGPEVDIDENASQANNLIALVMYVVWGIGLWMIWTDVLPALKALDNKPIFSAQNSMPPAAVAAQPKPVDNAENTPLPGASAVSASAPSINSVNELYRATYGDVLLFLVIIAIMFAAAWNLPSALEMIFLNQLPVDRSVRYAIKSLVSYVIVLLGMIFAFRALSISWSNVQWLATALTFGLAFGLQEIFANFVAGIILMFERPMRIGDWITIDEFTGMVTKIRTRATTIVNLDRKEYVIPNKDFITGRLINWTLSDAINRIEVTVGIAYGSDVNGAKQLLLEIAKAHPKVVAEPPASVVFREFGDSSLNLVLRAFLTEYECRWPTIDDLHTMINQAFNEAGIQIAFPQRDLHVRSIDETISNAFSPSQ